MVIYKITNLINNISGQNTGYYKEIKLTNTGNILNISYSNLVLFKNYHKENKGIQIIQSFSLFF